MSKIRPSQIQRAGAANGEALVFDAATGDWEPGDAYASSASRNVFVQQTRPVMTVPGVWFETNPDGSLKTVWVGTTT